MEMAEAEAPSSPARNSRGAINMALNLNENLSTNATNASAIQAHTTRSLSNVTVPQLQLKLPDLSTSDSASEGEDPQSQANGVSSSQPLQDSSGRAISPPPNCAICLGRCKNKCFTDSCFHQFCFKCLCEWSKVKPECPLCKQTFKSIIHNVKSMSQFERYHVQPPTVQIPHRPIEFTYRVPFFVDVVQGRIVQAALSAGQLSPLLDGGDASSRAAGGSGQNQVLGPRSILDEHPEIIVTSGTLSQQWRRYVYDRKMHAMPVCDITGRFRESNARFYRENPAQIHRLMPWINRDIVVLLRNTEHDVTNVLDCIKQSLSRVNILSPAFRRCLQPFLGSRTAHFIHELNNFARSPYDMIGYDRAVQYATSGTEEIVIEFSSSASSAEENEGTGAEGAGGGATTGAPSGRSRRQRDSAASDYRVHSRTNSTTTGEHHPMVNFLSFTISTTSEGAEAPGVTLAVSGRGAQATAINLTTHNRANEVIIDLEDTEANATGGNSGAVAASGTSNSTDATTSSAIQDVAANSTAPITATPMTTTATTTTSTNIELSSSTSDECEFVLERKPPHLRTPEMVSLNSETDSDVIFVEETKPLRQVTYSTSENEAEVKGAESKPNRLANLRAKMFDASAVKFEEELFNVGATTSAGLRSRYRLRHDSESRRNTASDIAQPRSQRKQQLRKRHRIRYSVPSCSETEGENEDERATYSGKIPKADTHTANEKRSTRRRTKKPSSDSSYSKRKHGDKSERTSRKRRKTKLSSGEETSDEEEDDGLNLIVLKNRLAAEKAQKSDGEPSTSMGTVSHNEIHSCAKWRDTAIAPNSAEDMRANQDAAQENTVREQSEEADTNANQTAQKEEAEERTTSRTSTLSGSFASSTANSQPFGPNSIASTPTTSSRSTSSAEEDSDSNAVDADHVTKVFMKKLRTERAARAALDGSDQLSLLNETNPSHAGAIMPLSAEGNLQMDPNCVDERTADAAIALSDFRNNDSTTLLELNLPPFSHNEESGSGSGSGSGSSSGSDSTGFDGAEDLDNEYNL